MTQPSNVASVGWIVNRAEARGLLADCLAEYRVRSYGELLRLLGAQETREVVGPSGVTYQLEFQALWDDQALGHLRVCGAIDAGGWRAFVPLTDDFIVDPGGRFIGE